jgi:macrodomain Ter protein organizer (MatP/YcbG family)
MRLDMRIDQSTRAKLRELAAEAGLTLSETVRRLIDDAYRRLLERRRLAAAERICALALEVPEKPEALCSELAVAHDAGVP